MMIKVVLLVGACCVFSGITKSHGKDQRRTTLPLNITITKQVGCSSTAGARNNIPNKAIFRNISRESSEINTTIFAIPSAAEQQESYETQLERLSTNEILLVCGFGFTFIVGILGNSFVCYFFGFKNRKNRTVTETLLFYLGFVDLLASFVNPLLFAYWTVTKYSRWDFGIIGCKILAPLAAATVTLSATTIMVICIDRYRAIVSPFKGQFTKRQVNVAMIIAIILSTVPYASYVYYLEVETGVPCMVKYGGTLGYTVSYVVITILRDVLYVCLFSFTSVAISRRLKQRGDSSVNEDYSRKCRKESSKIIRVLYRIGVVFAVLVIPKDLLSITTTISWLSPPGIRSKTMLLCVNGWLKVLNVSNSCANVFIYSHVHSRFKREICRLFAVFIRKRPQQSDCKQTLMTDCDGETHVSAVNSLKQEMEDVKYLEEFKASAL